MATLLEMAQQIVSAHATKTLMTTTELISEIQKVHSVLQSLESGAPETPEVTEPAVPTITLKQAFKTNEVVCMICGKGGMKTLTRHLNQAHDGLKPSQYRKQFNIPKTQALMSKAYAAKRKEIAAGMDLGANLEKARAARKGSAKKGKK
jgi:predicted transcriptional regulator